LIPVAVVELKFDYDRRYIYNWLYVSPDEQISAEVFYNIQSSVQVGFITCFPDNAYIMTAYPTGETISTSDFSAHFARYSIEAALSYHRRQVQAWTKVHGEPRRIRSIQDTDAIDHIYRERYRRLHFRRLFRHQAVGFALTILLFICNGLAIVLPPLDDISLSINLYSCGLMLGVFLALYGVWSAGTLGRPSGAIDDPGGARVYVPRR
jgi:hypothetical protein